MANLPNVWQWTYPMQFEVESTGVTDRLAFIVPAPQGCRGCVAVCATQTHPSWSRLQSKELCFEFQGDALMSNFIRYIYMCTIMGEFHLLSKQEESELKQRNFLLLRMPATCTYPSTTSKPNLYKPNTTTGHIAFIDVKRNKERWWWTYVVQAEGHFHFIQETYKSSLRFD